MSLLNTWKALLLTRRRLQLDPAKHLYFLCESGSLGLRLSGPRFDIQWCGFLAAVKKNHAFSCRNESSGVRFLRLNWGLGLGLCWKERFSLLMVKFDRNQTLLCMTNLVLGKGLEFLWLKVG